MVLPENIDASYPDRDPGDAAHQQHHDVIHTKVNALPAQVQDAATLDADVAADIATPGSATQGALSTSYASIAAAIAAGRTLPGSRRTGNLRPGTTTATVASTAHEAFPGLAVCSDGTLLSVWRSAPQHDPTPTPGVIKARRHGADLQPLGAEYTILTDALDLRDPVLTVLSDGRIALQCFKHDGAGDNDGGSVCISLSSDDGETFGALSAVPFTWDTNRGSSAPLVELADGTWLVAAYGRTSTTYNHCRLMRSTDGGATWTGETTIAEGQAESRNYTEPYVGVKPDGNLLCTIRVSDSDGSNPTIYSTTSSDGGLTWTAEAAIVTSASGRPAWTALASGGLLLTYRQGTAPYPMQYRTSWDDGATWSDPLQLGATPTSQGTYAQPVEIADGLVAVAYAIEANAASSSTVSLTYLADGFGVSPAGDDFTDPEGVLFLGAAEGGAAGGSTSFGQYMGWPVLQLAATGANQAGFAFRVPPSWKKYDVALLWTNMSGTGDVVFRHDIEQVSAGGTMTSAAGVQATVTASDVGVVVETPTASGVTRSQEFVRVKPTRLGDNASDTFTGNVGILGVRLTRTA